LPTPNPISYIYASDPQSFIDEYPNIQLLSLTMILTDPFDRFAALEIF
jgi:hypothetical protein